jgi:hypothetical protein
MSIATGLIAFAVGILYSSLFEWMLHRFILHSSRLLRGPYRAHQLEHHAIYRADSSYFFSPSQHKEGDKKHLTFAWWHGGFLIGLHGPLVVGAYALGGLWAAGGLLSAMITYYGLYEYLHYCMHVPKGRWIEKTGVFQAIQAHHRYHHAYFRRNLNVVFPIADVILRTRGKATPGLYEKLESVRARRADAVERLREPASASSSD